MLQKVGSFVIFILFYGIFIFFSKLDFKNNSPNFLLDKENDIRNFKNFTLFDTFLYNNEAAQAYTRIWRHYPYVDYFIIIYSDITFSGKKKNLSFYPFEKEIGQYKDKIRLVQYSRDKLLKRYRSKAYAWANEASSRDLATTYIEENFHVTNNDVLLVSDCDEIFTRKALRQIIQNPPETYYIVPGKQYFPYYFHIVDSWNRAFVIRYQPNLHLDYYRMISIDSTKGIKPDFGFDFITHCSYCFPNIEEYKNKLLSFSHVEYSVPPYTTNEWIFRSHYCRKFINQDNNPGIDEPIEDLEELFPPDERLSFLWDPSYEYDINATKYSEEDLKTLCPFNVTRRNKEYHPFLKS